MSTYAQHAKLRASLAALVSTNPIEVTTQQHLKAARVVVRCVVCDATEEGVFSVWFASRATLRHGINCAWLDAVQAFPELYRPRCHYCPGAPEGEPGTLCPHCQRPIGPGQRQELPPRL